MLSADRFRDITGYAAGLLSLVALILYSRAIVRRKMIPSRVTWWSWVGVQTCLTLYFWDSSPENREAIWVSIGYTLGVLLIALLSVKYGDKEWSFVEMIAIASVPISVGVWLIVNSLDALGVVLAVDALAAVFTAVKAYKEPRSEDLSSWVVGFTANLINLLAIQVWSDWAVTYPVYMVLMTGGIALVIRLRR